tara:strand:- start:2514 stop:2879 length:366 start_codon:yes stop_codon:yes gene_type:complete
MKKVEILGEIYKVTTKIPTKYREEVDPSLYSGLCFREDKIIWISPTLSGQEFYKTLIHEMGHALLYTNAVFFTGAISPELEEIIVETNSNMVNKFIVSMFKDILKGDEKDLKSKLSAYIDS